MKMATLATIGAGLVFAAGCGTQNPFGNESTPEEDDAAIATYTQTVNQVSTSEDTIIAPTIDGNNNQVTIIIGDDNDPDAVNTRNPPAPEEPETEAEGAAEQ
jgi:hypothetical protein